MLSMKETYKRSYTAHVDSPFAREKQEVALENLVYVCSPSKRILSLSTHTLQNATAFSSRNPPESFRTCVSNTRSVGKASRAWSSGCIHNGRTQHRDSCVRPPVHPGCYVLSSRFSTQNRRLGPEHRSRTFPRIPRPPSRSSRSIYPGTRTLRVPRRGPGLLFLP